MPIDFHVVEFVAGIVALIFSLFGFIIFTLYRQLETINKHVFNLEVRLSGEFVRRNDLQDMINRERAYFRDQFRQIEDALNNMKSRIALLENLTRLSVINFEKQHEQNKVIQIDKNDAKAKAKPKPKTDKPDK